MNIAGATVLYNGTWTQDALQTGTQDQGYLLKGTVAKVDRSQFF